MELRMVCPGKWKGEPVKNFKVQQYRDERIKTLLSLGHFNRMGYNRRKGG